MDTPQAKARVALVYQAAALPEHLKQALGAVGIDVALEATYGEFSAGQADGLGLQAVIVNLDNDDDDALLDQVSEAIDALGCELVFNDALASGALSGWDQARWARHLASKIAGAGDIHPPRPEGAESIPVPGSAAVATSELVAQPSAAPTDDTPAPLPDSAEETMALADAALDEASAILDAPWPDSEAAAADGLEDIPEAGSAPDDAPVPPGDAPDDAELFGAELESLVAEAIDGARPDAALAEPESAAPSAAADELLMDLAAALDEVPSAERLPAADAPEQPSADLQDDGSSIDELVALIENVPEGVDFSPGDQDDFAAGTDDGSGALFAEADDGLDLDLDSLDSGAGFARFSSDEAVVDGGLDLDDEAAQLAAQLEAALAETQGGLPEDLSDALVRPSESAVQAPPAPAEARSWSLELEAVDEDSDAAELPAPAAAPVASTAPTRSFDLERFSLLDPEAEDGQSQAPAEQAKPAPRGYDFSSLTLELEPVEEEAAANADQAAAQPVESWLVAPTSTSKTANSPPVWVLGASIGGPEAVREFLGALPQACPAIFVLVQHMGSEFQDLMTQQLDRATPLRVRLAKDGDRAEPGDVIVVPVGKRFRMLADGNLRLDDLLETGQYNPCIDDVLRDLAEIFGKRANAIVFSGMARDAIEGCAEVVRRGGKVWVQDPSSCVISSMIDGVRERKLDSYMGSPTELANELKQVFAKS